MKHFYGLFIAAGLILSAGSTPCASAEFRLGAFPLNLSIEGVKLKSAITIWVDAKTETKGIKAKLRGRILVDSMKLEDAVIQVSRKRLPLHVSGADCLTVHGVKSIKIWVESQIAHAESILDVEQTCVTLPLVPSRSDVTLGFGFKVARNGPHKLGLKAISRTVLLPTAWWILRDYGKQVGDEGEAFINQKIEIELDGPKYLQYAWQQAAFEQQQRALGVNLSADAYLLQDSFSKNFSDIVDKIEIQIPVR